MTVMYWIKFYLRICLEFSVFFYFPHDLDQDTNSNLKTLQVQSKTKGFEDAAGAREDPAFPHPPQQISPFIIILCYKNLQQSRHFQRLWMFVANTK
jgi:hypothetical protein